MTMKTNTYPNKNKRNLSAIHPPYFCFFRALLLSPHLTERYHTPLPLADLQGKNNLS
ncbi:hypothetical protein H5U35_06235 [Candidatus Aerophobetes bacterium]|nr:hypothetical protein [Candidatus Aerophobetes bacterium]